MIHVIYISRIDTCASRVLDGNRFWAVCSENYLEVYWPCAGGLSAVNAIGTQLRDPINSGLTRWRMAVS